MKRIFGFFLCFVPGLFFAQSTWPSESWNSAAPLTSVMNAGGLLELSGLHWNPESNRLYVVHGDGRLRVLQLNMADNTFAQIGNKTLNGGPEGITQANFSANEFYTIDENNYEIRKYTHAANFSTVTESRHWDLLQLPSPMEDTGNTGPEGIVFVPDANLTANGFTSALTGQPYTSVKGAGGLFFIAHQDGGYIWVFDINPNVSNDFAYVGKYKTNHNESCDLSFDRSTGLLYILHNIGSNYLEVTDLSLAPVSETKFATVSEYFLANPSGANVNVEGFALMPKCNTAVTGSAFLCRDVESDEAAAVQQDAIRWFSPFNADGNCAPLQADAFSTEAGSVDPNPASDKIAVSGLDAGKIAVYNALGQMVFARANDAGSLEIDVSAWDPGMYFIRAESDGKILVRKFLKK